MRSTHIVTTVGVLLAVVAACGGDDSKFKDGSSSGNTSSGNITGGDGGASGGPGGCVGLECKQAVCGAGNKTTISGTVYDPAGKNALYEIAVYVPTDPSVPLPPITEGMSCDRCNAHGSVLAAAITDTNGHFKLDNVPADTDFPLVLEVGKWRRQIPMKAVKGCVETPIDDPADPNAKVLRLPRNRNEGSIPRIAVSTGGADPLECLFRKIGIDDAEFGIAGSDARVHMYGGYGITGDPTYQPTHAFAATLNGGASFPDAEPFYSDFDNLKKYDIVILACEGTDNVDKKPNRQALVDFTAKGGRVFASHWHQSFFDDPDRHQPGRESRAIPEGGDVAAPDARCSGSDASHQYRRRRLLPEGPGNGRLARERESVDDAEGIADQGSQAQRRRRRAAAHRAAMDLDGESGRGRQARGAISVLQHTGWSRCERAMRTRRLQRSPRVLGRRARPCDAVSERLHPSRSFAARKGARVHALRHFGLHSGRLRGADRSGREVSHAQPGNDDIELELERVDALTAAGGSATC
jgi:hypothetical protein